MSKTRQWDFKIQCFGPAPVHFFSYILALKTRFELSRVKLHKNDLRENKNYFELAWGSSYRGFELFEGIRGEIDFGSS